MLFFLRQGKEEADVVDSDFDIDEDDAPVSDQDEEEGKRTRSRRLITKAYKEPVRKKAKVVIAKKQVKEKDSEEEDEEEAAPSTRLTRRSSRPHKSPSPAPGPSKGRITRHSALKVESDVEPDTPTGRVTRKRKYSEAEMPDFTPKALEESRPRRKPAVRTFASPRRRGQFSTEKKSLKKTMRSSTKLKSIETQKRVKEREKESDQRKKYLKSRKIEYEMPTQEELMEETKWTEIVNLESLGETKFFACDSGNIIFYILYFIVIARFQQLELEKKKTKPTKNVVSGPKIRYHSVTMPRVLKSKKSGNDNEEQVDLLRLWEDGEEKDSAPVPPPVPKLEEEAENVGGNAYERTFISFSDEDLMKKYFPTYPKPVRRKSRRCALTR